MQVKTRLEDLEYVIEQYKEGAITYIELFQWVSNSVTAQDWIEYHQCSGTSIGL